MIASRLGQQLEPREIEPMSIDDLSSSGVAVLCQLFKNPVWDGDLVSKEGRTELVRLGLAQRCRRDERGLAVNELSEAGRAFANAEVAAVDAAVAMAIKKFSTVH